MRTMFGLALVLALVATSGCRPAGEPETPGPQACSAAQMSATVEPQDLPGPAASMREQIVEAAVDCDYDRLEALAGSDDFSYSFGEQGDPASYWRAREEAGEDVMATLVRILQVPPAELELEETLYVWPAAAARDEPLESDWGELEQVYPAEEVERLREQTRDHGVGYLGYRAGISADGQWRYFVAGD